LEQFADEDMRAAIEMIRQQFDDAGQANLETVFPAALFCRFHIVFAVDSYPSGERGHCITPARHKQKAGHAG
jgi:hypothetical protein